MSALPRRVECEACATTGDPARCAVCVEQNLPPFTHQYEDFLRFRTCDHFALFWEMGTGKTKEAIDIACHKFRKGEIDRVVLIAPNTVHAQWVQQELPKHCSVPYTAFVYHTNKKKGYQRELSAFFDQCAGKDKLHWFALHVESFQTPSVHGLLRRFMPLTGTRPMWLVDEGTRIKNTKTKTYENIRAAASMYDGPRVLLTGTALAKSPVDVYGMLEFVQPGFFGCSFTAFQQRHAILMKKPVEYERNGRTHHFAVPMALSEKVYERVKRDLANRLSRRINGRITTQDLTDLALKYGMSETDVAFVYASKGYTKYKNVDQLKEYVSKIASMRRKEECVQLPEKVYQTIEFDLTPAQKKILMQLQKYAVAQYGEEELTVVQKQTLQLRALQVCGGFFPHVTAMSTDEERKYSTTRMSGTNEKLEYIKKDIAEVSGAFIVWAVFRAELDMLYKELNELVPVGLLSGGQQGKYDETVQAFQSGELQGLVANPVVAGYGLNFQHASVQYWYSRNYRTEARLQAEDRSHRIGITRAPVYKDLVYRCQFERQVLQDNKLGRDMNAYFNAATVAQLFAV